MTATPERWARYHAYRRQRHQESRPEDPLTPDDATEIQMRWPDKFNEQLWYEATLAGETVGWLEVSAPRPTSPEYPSWRHMVFAHGAVLGTHRRKRVGTALLAPVIGYMRERGATVADFSTHETEGAGFLDWLGAEAKFKGGENRLDLTLVDWPMVERWVREGVANQAGTRLEIYEPRIPDDLLEWFCSAYTALINTVPFEELDHGEIFYTPEIMRDQYGLSEKLGRVHHVAVTREVDGSMSGMTELLHYPYHPDRVHQELTAVDAKQRGRGLGKWLKAALLLRAREAYPDLRVVITENAGSNAPMLAINERLGFKLHRAQMGYQSGLESLEKVAPVSSVR
jgi:GNAT superfamily N-acetyltransferase